MLASQIARHNDIVDLNRVGCNLNFDDADEFSHKFAEQSECGRDGRGRLFVEKRADRIAIARFNRPDEEFLPAHALF